MGSVITFVNVSTHQCFEGGLIGIRSNVTISGSFGGLMEFSISNSATFGDTPTGPKPAGFPEFRDDSCSAGPTQGAWGSVPNITMVIQEVVADETASFGAVKARF